MDKLLVEAESLQEAESKLIKKIKKIPKGFKASFKCILNNGEPVQYSGVGESESEAFAIAEKQIPKDAVIIEKRVIQEPKKTMFTVDAFNEPDAWKLALKDMPSDADIEPSVSLTKAGKSGFLGFGVKPNTYKVEFHQKSHVLIVAKSKACIQVYLERETQETNTNKAAGKKPKPYEMNKGVSQDRNVTLLFIPHSDTEELNYDEAALQNNPILKQLLETEVGKLHLREFPYIADLCNDLNGHKIGPLKNHTELWPHLLTRYGFEFMYTLEGKDDLKKTIMEADPSLHVVSEAYNDGRIDPRLLRYITISGLWREYGEMRCDVWRSSKYLKNPIALHFVGPSGAALVIAASSPAGSEMWNRVS